MAELSRTGASIDTALLQAFRNLIRDHLVATWVPAADAEVAGTVKLIYDHHSRLLPEKLTDILHPSKWSSLKGSPS
jgi:CopG family nickel-responsive transcriptional regulator